MRRARACRDERQDRGCEPRIVAGVSSLNLADGLTAVGGIFLRGRQGRAIPPPILHTCQWIDGEPSADDACKCGAATVPGKPYCAAHWARAWVQPEPA
jgi:hypothetical protein